MAANSTGNGNNNSQSPPTYQTLFESGNYYPVDPARSVLSPAAYLVDLLNLVQNNISVSNSASNNDTSIQTRRGDIFNLSLDKENTDNELPKIQIVNEVLANYLPPVSTSLSLAKRPSGLSTKAYPFGLPYNQSLDQIRHYLAQNGTSLAEIWKSLIPKASLTTDQVLAIQLATLGISNEQWTQYSNPASVNTINLLYGLSLTAGSNGTLSTTVITPPITVDAFLSATGLDYDLLMELLYQDLSEKELAASPSPVASFYINTGTYNGSNGTVAIENGALQNVSAYTLDRIQRFIRLAKAIGWSFADLDWALQTIGNSINNGSPSISISLPYLAWMQNLIKNNGLSVNQCCASIGTLKDYGRKNGKLTFFDQVFNNPNNPNFTWSASPTPSWTVGQSGQPAQSALATALQVSEDNLTSLGNLFLQSQPSSTNQISLTNGNLAILYRLSLLLEMTGLSFKKSLVAVNLIAQSQNIAQAINSTSASGITYAIDALIEFAGWLKKSPFSIYELQFILTGQSSDAATQNKILGMDAITNFLQDLTASIEKTLLIKRVFYNDTKTSLQSLYSELAPNIIPNIIPALQASAIGNLTKNTALTSIIGDAELVTALQQTFPSLPASPTTTDISTLFANSTDVQIIIQNENLLTALQNLFPNVNITVDYVQRWANYFVYAQAQSNVQSISENIHEALTPQYIDSNSVVLFSSVDNSALQALIENSLLNFINLDASLNMRTSDLEKVWKSVSTTDLITAITTTLASYHQLQEKTFIQHLSSLYKVSSQTGALIKQIGDMNIEALISAELSTSTPHLLAGLITSHSLSPLQYDLQQSTPALQKLQQAAELIRVLSLSPAEVEYFKPTISYSAQEGASGISIETVKSMLLLKELVTGFQDAQNNLLGILRNDFLTTANVQCLYAYNGILYVGTNANGLWTYDPTAPGTGWTQITNIQDSTGNWNIQIYWTCIDSVQGIIYVGTWGSFVWSLNTTDESPIWKKEQYLQYLSGTKQVFCTNNYVYAGLSVDGCGLASIDLTATNPAWQNNQLSSQARIINCLCQSGNTLYAGDYFSGLWYQVDNDAWQQVTTVSKGSDKLPAPKKACINSLHATRDGKYVLAGGTQGLWILDNTQSNPAWKQVQEIQEVNAVAYVWWNGVIDSSNGVIYAGTQNNGLWVYNTQAVSPSWTQVASVLASDGSTINQASTANISCVRCVTHNNRAVTYVGTFGNGLWFSHDNGQTWSQVGFGQTYTFFDVSIVGNSIYAGTEANGLWVGSSNGVWSQMGRTTPSGIQTPLDNLANLSSWKKEQIKTLMNNFISASWFSSTDFTVAKVALLKQYFDTGELLGINTDTLWDLIQLPSLSSTSTPTKAESEINLSQALWGGLQGQYQGQQQVLSKIQGTLNEKLRDKLVPILMKQLGVSTPRVLYEHLLIDVEVSAHVQTSYVREAISAVQLYVYRCLNQLEPSATVNPALSTLWTWMYGYREWQANKEVFLYPEDYIQPELRKNKTDLFAKAEAALKQANLSDPNAVKAVFREYMNGFSQIANLKIVGTAAHCLIVNGINTKQLCMVGMTRRQPHQYYWRVATFVLSEGSGQYEPTDWGQWEKFNIQIQPVKYGAATDDIGAVTPVFAFGKWYIFWVEQKQSGKQSSVSTEGTGTEGVSIQSDPIYTVSIHYSHMDFSNRWVTAQVLCSEAGSSPSLITLPTSTFPLNTHTAVHPIYFSSIQTLYVPYNAQIYTLSESKLAQGVIDAYRFVTTNEIKSTNTNETWLNTSYPATSKTPRLQYCAESINPSQKSLSVSTWFKVNGTGMLQLMGLLSVQAGHRIYLSGVEAGNGPVLEGGEWYHLAVNNSDVWVNGIVITSPKAGIYGEALVTVKDKLEWKTFKSTDGATTWGDAKSSEYIVCCVFNGVLYAAGNPNSNGEQSNGLYKFAEGKWEPIYFQDKLVISLCVFEGALYAVIKSNGLYKSTDGQGWSQIMDLGAWANNDNINALCVFEGALYAISSSTADVYKSTDDTNWNATSSFGYTTPALCVFEGALYASNFLGGGKNWIFKSKDGSRWVKINEWQNSECIFFNLTGYSPIGNIRVITTSRDYEMQETLFFDSSLTNTQVKELYDNSLCKVTHDFSAFVETDDAFTASPPPLSTTVLGQPNWNIVLGDDKSEYLMVTYQGSSEVQFNTYRLNTTALPDLGTLLHSPAGLNALLSISAQESPEEPFSDLDPVSTYIPASNTPSDQIDFTSKSAMKNYYWELFFHLPFLIANELNTQQHFAHAKKWLQYIFNPEISAQNANLSASDTYNNDMYWRFVGLRSFNNTTNTVLQQELSQTALQQEWSDMTNNLQLFEMDIDPFDPQAIANLRPIAYQKTIVMHYIKNLLDWGDMLYRENTRESINEAEMLYVAAYDLLGQKPRNLGKALTADNTTYNSISAMIPITALVQCLAQGSSYLYAGTTQGLYYKETAGSWVLLNNTVPANANVQCLQYINDTLYIGTTKGLYSGSGGNSGTWVAATFPNSIQPNVQCLSMYNNTQMVVGTASGLYWCNTGSNYIPVSAASNNGLPQYANIQCLAMGTTLQYAGTNQGLYYREANGSESGSWVLLNNTVPANANVQCLQYISDTLYIGTTQGLYTGSGGNSGTWVAATFPNSIQPNVQCLSMYTLVPEMVVGTSSGLYYCSSGSTYSAVLSATVNGLPQYANIQCLAMGTTLQYAGTNQGLYYREADGTEIGNWVLLSTVVPANVDVQCLQYISGTLYVRTIQGFYAGSGGNTGKWGNVSSHYFGIPRDTQFLSYWDEVKQRIYNIRQGLTIDGQTDILPLFQPPINPMVLVSAVASGQSVAQAIQSSSNSIVPYYRFETMIEKAKEVTSTVIQLGQSLLSALEAKDNQKLAELYTTNQQNILNLSILSKQDQLLATGQNILALQAGLTSAQNRQTYYNQMITGGLSSTEQKQINLANDAITAQDIIRDIKIAAAIGYAIPTIYGFSDGGFHPGDVINQASSVAESIGSLYNQRSGLAGVNASYQRRAQDWGLQKTFATDDISQLNYQIVAAQYQQDLAQQEIDLLNKNIEQQKKVAQFYLNKFTNDQLYNWYIGQVSSLYYQSYQLAKEMALQAQNAWQFENIGRRKDLANFINPGHWNSLYEGLLAGESLQLNLQQMEKAYLDQNQRKLEIKKTISLAQLDPVQLMTLIQTGSCQIDITEKDFAFDFPGHYCRQIKSISITIPMILGPYQNIHATLTQLTNKLVSTDNSDGQNAVGYLLNPYNASTNSQGVKLNAGNTALTVDLVLNQQVALSQGINDTGMFELNFNDARYLPFEGTGAVSCWLLEMPLEENSINFESITDVIIEMNYTALQGSSAYKTAVTAARRNFNGTQVISLAQDFPSAWLGFTDVTSIPLTFSLNTSRWKGVGNQNAIVITAITAYAQVSKNGSTVSENGSMASDCELQLEYDGSNPEVLKNWSNNIASLSSLNLGPTQLRNKCSLTLTSGALPTNSTTNAVLLTNLILIVDYTVQPIN